MLLTAWLRMACSEVYECVFCDKGDNVVFCNGIDCPICVHLECVEDVDEYVEDGKFYCVYCGYKRDLSEVVELFREKEKAKEDLESFLSLKMARLRRRGDGGNEVEENGGGVCEMVGCGGGGGDGVEEDKGEENCGGIRELGNGNGGGDDGAKESMNEENVHVGGEGLNADEKNADFIVVSEDDDDDVEGKDSEDNVVSEDDDDDVEEKDGEDNGEASDQKMDERVVEEENQVEANLVSSGEGRDSISDYDSETLDVYCRRRGKTKLPKPSQYVLHPNAMSPRRKISKRKLTEVETVSVSKQPKKSEECSKKTTNMQGLATARKRSYWRPEEEEMLKEGVFKFSSKINKNIPWRKILDLGRRIFDSNRTPADLKDKWRKMNK